MRQVWAICIGMAGGIISGLLGIGGSFLVVPLLVGILGIDRRCAHGTALSTAFFSSLAAGGSYLQAGYANWNIVAIVLMGSVLGSVPGTWAMSKVGSRLLNLLFVFFLAATALEIGLGYSHTWTIGNKWLLIPVELGLGIAAGFFSGFFGIGGGAVVVPGLVMFFAVSQKMAQGISLLVIIPTALVGTIVHYRTHNLAIKTLPYLGMGAMLGGVMGSILARCTPELWLRCLFIGALGLVVVSSILQDLAEKRAAPNTIPKSG